MDPATLMLIVQGVGAAISAAPQIEAVVVSAKNFITSLFEGGVITIDQQAAVHSHIDALVAAANSGTVPPEFQVGADPVV
jgi:hypothetical protein